MLALVTSACTFALPIAPSVTEPVAEHWRTAVASAAAAIFIGAACCFIAGLKGFRASFRAAYGMLAAGLILYSIAILQLPILGLYDLWNTPYAQRGGAILPFIVATLLIYAGMRKFVRLLGIQTVLQSFWMVLLILIGTTIVGYIAGHLWVQYKLEGVDIYIGTVAGGTSSVICAALITHTVTQGIGQHYQQPMRWLEIGLTLFAIAGVHECVTTFFLNNGHPYEDYGVYLWPFVLSGVLLVYAGNLFRLSARQTLSLAAEAAGTKPAGYTDFVDSITAVADLASRPKDIDPILDTLRDITARHIADTPLSANDEDRLLNVYRRIESYLSESDPLRRYTPQELAARTTPAFQTRLGKK